MSEWFGTWFDSEYYHLLYKDRSFAEAEAFVEKVVNEINPSADALIHDLACGKGRHSIHLHKMGLHVEGSDYSSNSIDYAKQFENDRLRFFVHDMRNSMPKKYNYVFNLFTSFGYFDTDAEHLDTLQHIYNGLHDEGIFVFDFMNVAYVLQHLVPKEIISKEHISFHIKREVVNHKITKHISFEEKGKSYYFKEEVAALGYDKIMKMMKSCGFSVLHSWGSYDLKPFDLQKSKRLILVLRK